MMFVLNSHWFHVVWYMFYSWGSKKHLTFYSLLSATCLNKKKKKDSSKTDVYCSDIHFGKT